MVKSAIENDFGGRYSSSVKVSFLFRCLFVFCFSVVFFCLFACLFACLLGEPPSMLV